MSISTAPPMAYFGGKTRLAQRIVELLPGHQHYVEPFAGSLAVLLAKKPSRMETVNDLDGLLMTFWRVLRDRPAELARACALTPHSRAEYLAARDASLDGLDDLEIARLVWVQIAQGRGGTMRATGWRTYIDPAGSSKSMPQYLDAYVDRMAVAAQRLQRVSLESRPALEIIEQFGTHRECCLYLDPPYLASTRGSGGGNGYRLEMKTVEQHADLLDAASRCRASVVLSGYASEQYETALADWWRLDIPTRTGQGVTNQARTEVIWSNRPLLQQMTIGYPEAGA